MKIICISDTHGLHRQTEIPDGDILIHAGDISLTGSRNEIIDFNNWLEMLPHQHKIVIGGNHDFWLEEAPHEASKILSNAIYLNDSGIEIDGIKFWGSPISPISSKFGKDWAYNRERGAVIRQHWNKIPMDVDMLITHCPPATILDKNEINSHEGCADLLEVVRKIKPQFHVFGHIHEAYGQAKVDETTYINASMVGLNNSIARFVALRKLRILAIFFFQQMKEIYKQFHPKKKKLQAKRFAKYHWKLRNKAVVIEI